MCNTLVISVITRQQGKCISKDILTLFMEMCDTLVISVIIRPHGKEVSKDIIFMDSFFKISFPFWFAITLITSELHISMNRVYMCFKISFLCCLVFTLITCTRVTHISCIRITLCWHTADTKLKSALPTGSLHPLPGFRPGSNQVSFPCSGWSWRHPPTA